MEWPRIDSTGLAVAPVDAAAAELQKNSRRFLDVLAVTWLATAALVDLQVVRDGPSVIGLELRLLGLVAILAARVFLRGDRTRHGVFAVVAATGATTMLLCGAIAATAVGAAGAYATMPVLWWLALAAIVAPRPLLAAGVGVVWLVAFAVPRAGAEDGARVLLAALPVWGCALALSALISAKFWQLRYDLYDARRLGRYRLLSPIGHGGMNDVWLAWDETRRREVALKLLRIDGTAVATRARFEREAELVRMARSPYIVRILDFGITGDGFAYIALEYLRGLDLEALVHTFGPLEPRRAIQLMRQACRGLGAAHEAGVLHHDVKPANIHCSDQKADEDHVRILDFGVAQTTSEGRRDMVAGTPAYMPPEAFRGEATTPASDVYSLGATFYYALTGSPPVEGATHDELQRAHELAPIVPPSLRAGVDLPRAVERVILRCLAKHPEDRYPDGNAVGDALDQAVRHLPAWTHDDAAEWWRTARSGGHVPAVGGAEHTTDVAVVREPRRERAQG